MSTFALIVAQSREDPEAKLLLRSIEYGSDEEGEQALRKLVEYAQQSGDPDDWNATGLGLHYRGQHGEAVRVFDILVQQYPEEAVYRLNLATSYSQTEEIELCRYHLRYLAEHGSTEQNRQLGREQLEGYERFAGLTEEDRRLRELQIQSLRQAIQRSEPSLEDFIVLARLLLLRSKIEPKEDLLAEATLVLEQGQQAFPQETSLLEMLAHCYLRRDPDNRLFEILTLLEKIDPNSIVLESFAEHDANDAAAFSRDVYERAMGLMQKAGSKDAGVREASLQDLSRIVTTFPDNKGYRLLYAFALMSGGRAKDALQEAQRLAHSPINDHSFHFNLGQIFWICGDPVQGRHHLDRALHYAQDEQERQDVHNRLSELKGI